MSFNTIFLIIWNVFWLGFAAYMLATTGRRIYLHDKSYKLYNKAVALLESKIARGQVSRLESIGIRHNLLNMYLGDKIKELKQFVEEYNSNLFNLRS